MAPEKSSTPLDHLVTFCNKELQHDELIDYSGAINGLQIENSGNVSKIGAAVDASYNVINQCVKSGIDFLVVHHGLFWTTRTPWTGTNYKMLKTLIQNDISIYSSHLPLDLHPILGNNAQIIDKMDLTIDSPCGNYKGQPIGYLCKESMGISDFSAKVNQLFDGKFKQYNFGPSTCHKIAIISGGAGSEIAELAKNGVDCLLTGEGPHWTYSLAQELKINLFYAGHYATETFGVKALSSYLASKFNMPWEFIDDPSFL